MKKQVYLKDVCEKGSSNITQKDLESNQGAYPIYGASGLIKHIDFFKQDKPYIAIVKDGAGVGRTMLLPAYSSVIGTMQYIFPKDNIHIRYLYHALSWMNLGKYYTGATIPHIYFKDYQDEPLMLPSMEEQEEIVSVLDKLDQLVEQRKKQLSKLDELVKSHFIELFGDIPSEDYKSLSDVCKIITDGTHQPPKFVDKGIPFLLVSNITSNAITYDTPKYITQETYDVLMKRTPIEIGDILLSTVGSYGHPAIVKDTTPFSFQRHIAYLKPDASKINSVYLHTAILSEDVQNQIEVMVLGVAQKTLNLSSIRGIKIPVPSLERQLSFNSFVEQTDKSKFEIQKSLEKLETLKKALMQKYFG